MTSSSSETLSAFVASDDGRPLIFEQLPFDHPLYILSSSGTTGPPKCIVHSGGVCELYTTKLDIISRNFQGVLIQTKKELAAHVEVGIDDTYFQFTTVCVFVFVLVLHNRE
jgi:acetoacetyl-CoA synthetase